MAQIDVVFPHSSKTEGIIRNGHSTSGAQLYRCKLYLKTFQLNVHYNAARPNIHQSIIDMAMNGARCRGTTRVGNASNWLNSMYNVRFEVYPWPTLSFIAPVVSLLWFIIMDRTRKDMTASAAETATASFNSITHIRPANRGIKEQITEMTFNGAAFAIPLGH